ncbi:MAG: shikimate kinase [Clostridia bacterium]|nr:shikimate kinase [Clostridia bacterium]
MRKDGKNIILIGMPASGKSTLGVVLAKMAGMNFLDCDLLIQQKQGRLLQNIIDEEGAQGLLKIEQDVLSRIDVRNTVISTGGSAVCGGSAVEKLRQNGVCVYLNVPLDEIKRRIDNIETRGIACKKGETLDDVYAERAPLYEKYADITVKTCGMSMAQAARLIIDECRRMM